MEFALIVVGDEILSGKRQDKHFARVLGLLQARGLSLARVAYLGDDRRRLVDALRASFAAGDPTFCCGGIGATPDDHTRQAAAEAIGVPLALHPDAARLITERTAEMAARDGRDAPDMRTPENRQRLKMGEFPVGSRIIPNPYNRIPGFEIRDHFFVPGFPVMAWPMIEAVLDDRFAHLHHRAPRGERSLLLFGVAEADATPLMEAVEAEFPGFRVFSLPTVGDADTRRHIELGVKGPLAGLEAAWARLEAGARQLGGEVRLRD